MQLTIETRESENGLKHSLIVEIVNSHSEELGNDVHCQSNGGQVKICAKTTKGIADCMGCECNEDMRKSVNDRVEVIFKELDEPKRDMTTHKMKKCEKDLAKCHKKLDSESPK